MGLPGDEYTDKHGSLYSYHLLHCRVLYHSKGCTNCMTINNDAQDGQMQRTS